MSHYKLLFTPAKGDTGSKTEFSLSTASQIPGSDSEEYINRPNKELSDEVKNVDITFALDEVSYDRQLYSPCQVTALVSVTPAQDAGQSSDLDLQDISNIFLGKTVEIRCSASLEGFGEYDSAIGNDYFVYNVKPGFVNSSKGMKCKVELTIYSRDYWLKTLKYSRSYISQKLGEDIIRKSLSDNGVLSKYKVDFDVSAKRLRNTTYKPDSGDEEAKELIQPYHIQNNEDFYTFLSRIAIRHGEYLFFENGKLTLGLDNETEAVSLDPIEGMGSKYSIVSKMSLQASCNNPLETNTYYKNYNYHVVESGVDIWGTNGRYTVSNKAAGEPITVDASKLYFNEDAFDEHFDVCSLNSDSYPSSVMQQEPLGEIGIKWLFTELCPMIAEFRGRGGFFGGYALLRNVILEMVIIQVKAVRMNNDFNKKYREAVDIGVARSEEQKNGDYVSQFATLTQEETLNASNFMHAYYTAVREGEQAVLESVVTFSVAPAVCGDIKLGAKVSYNGVEYFVTRIYGKKATGVDETYIEAVPVMKVAERTDLTDDQKKENPWKSKVKMLPPYNKCYEHPLAMPQVAVVVDSNDPRYLNRVRVRYPWQAKDEPASVWMRVQTPFSTANGAFHFSPSEGDEVMVNYEAGNIDRPFVSGFLFNSQNMPSMFPFYASREIRTENGSRIVLGKNTGNAQSYIDSVVPILSFATPFLGPEMKDLTENASNISPAAAKLFGNVTLTDGFGMFEISGDTAKRQVYLNSTAGKVLIEALTGVDILASLGDIKIKAKNISIEADNRISIVSGLSIKDALDKQAQINRKERLLKNGEVQKSTGGAFLAAAGDYASMFVCEVLKGKTDFSIIRSVWEAIFPPMDGTLKLKSYRYVQMEAGKGMAMDCDGGFQTNRPYGDSRFVRVDNICRHLVMKSLRSRLKKMKSSAKDYKKYVKDPDTYECLITVDEVIDKAIQSNFNVDAVNFVTKTDAQLRERLWSEYYSESEFIGTKNVIAMGVERGKALVKALKNVYDIYTNINKSKTFKSFEKSEKVYDIQGFDAMIATIKNCWAESIQGKKQFEEMVKEYYSQNEHHVFLDKMYKSFFRNVVYSIFSNEGIKYFPVFAQNLPPVVSKADITDAEWKKVIDSIDRYDESLVDDDTEKETGSTVSRDAFRDLADYYKKQFNSPSSIWGIEQEGCLLISDSEGKTMKMSEDKNEWVAKENVTTTAVARNFLFKK